MMTPASTAPMKWSAGPRAIQSAVRFQSRTPAQRRGDERPPRSRIRSRMSLAPPSPHWSRTSSAAAQVSRNCPPSRLIPGKWVRPPDAAAPMGRWNFTADDKQVAVLLQVRVPCAPLPPLVHPTPSQSSAATYYCRVASRGEHIFARYFMRPDALEVAVGPGEHIFARHFMRPEALEVAIGLGTNQHCVTTVPEQQPFKHVITS